MKFTRPTTKSAAGHTAPRRTPRVDMTGIRSMQHAVGNQGMQRLLESPPLAVDRVLRSPGATLPSSIRLMMEQRFDRDLRDVRVHTGESAAQAADGINARAFAHGNHIVFGRGEFDTVTTSGRTLLAHELAHVIQQRRGGAAPYGSLSSTLERASRSAAEAAVRGSGPVSVEGASAPGIARQEKSETPALPQLHATPVGANAYMVTIDGVLVFQVEVPESVENPAFGFRVMPREGKLLIEVEGDRSIIVLQQNNALRDLAAKGYDAVVLDRRRSKLSDERAFNEIPPPRIGPAPSPPQPKPQPKVHRKAPQKSPARPADTAPKQKAELPPLPPPTAERSDTFEPPPPSKAAPPKPEDLIDAHTSLFNLDEEKLGQRLLDYALENNPDYVQSVLDSVGLFDRDDVSVAFAEAASDEDLQKMAATPEGRRLLARLFDELTEGEVGDDEQKQANRILAIQTKALLSEREFAEGIERAKERIVLPYRKPGLTVITPSPIYAYRTDKGKIQVRLRTDIYGTEYYEDKDIRLPDRIWQGIELEETDIVGVKFYDDEGRIDFFPALYLLQLNNESTRVALHKMGEAAGLGLTLGAGTVVGAGGESAVAVSEMSTAGRALYYGGRALSILDHVAIAMDVTNTVIQEHRSWILEQTGGHGRELIHAFDRLNSYLQIYGLVRGGVGLVKLAAGLRKSYQQWRAFTRTLEETMSEADKAAVRDIGNATEDALKEIDNLATAPTNEATPGTPSQLPAAKSGTGAETPAGPVLAPEAQVPPQPRVKAVPGRGTPTEGPRGKLRLVQPEGKVPPKEPPPSEPMSAEMPLEEELDVDVAELEPVKQASGAPGAERFVRPQAVKGGGKSGPAPSPSQAPVVQLKPKATGTGAPTTAKTPSTASTSTKKLPSPSELERSVGAAVESNVSGLDPSTNFSYRNRNLKTITDDLKVRQSQLNEAGKGDLLPQVDTSIMDLSAADFMKRHPDLQQAFDALMQRALREKSLGNGELYEEVSKFLSEGKMSTRRPDTVELRLDAAAVSLTDATIKTNRAKVLMHEFKTRFYGEATRDIFGSEGPAVSAFEHNPALGVHRPAR